MSLELVLLFSQFYDFQILEAASLNGEADECACLVPSLKSGGSGVDVQTVERTVMEHFENVRMAGDEKLWRVHVEASGYAAVVVPRITADVLDEDVCFFTLEAQNERIHSRQVATVTIAADGTKRFDVCEAFGKFHCTDVACMPYFVAFGEILCIAVVPITVSVRQQTNAFHAFSVILRSANSLMNAAVCSMPNTEELMQRW